MQAKILLHNFLTNGTVISANLREVWTVCLCVCLVFIFNCVTGCLYWCRSVGRIHILAILLGQVHVITRNPRGNNRTNATVASFGQNERCMVGANAKHTIFI